MYCYLAQIIVLFNHFTCKYNIFSLTTDTNGRIINTFLFRSKTVCNVNISATIVFPKNKTVLIKTDGI